MPKPSIYTLYAVYLVEAGCLIPYNPTFPNVEQFLKLYNSKGIIKFNNLSAWVCSMDSS